MDILNILSVVASTTGITGATLCAVFRKFCKLKTKKVLRSKFGFDDKTIEECVKRYVEPVYAIEKEQPKCSLMRMMKKIVFKYDQKMVFVLGATGVGKSIMVNRFIYKYALYSEWKEKKIVRIFGMEYSDIVRRIDDIENKEHTILIIDGLDEIFAYRENHLSILDNFKERLLPFFKVIITMNLHFYEKYKMKFENFYHRNADEDKIFAIKIYLKTFPEEKIKKYINKNIDLPKIERQEIYKKAVEKKYFYSNPLMLKFIMMLTSYEGNFTSYFEVLNHISKKSIEWEGRKYDRKSQTEKAKRDAFYIMRNISRQFLKGNPAEYKTENKFRNVLLIYNEKTKSYRFQNSVFLFYNVAHSFYTKVSDYNSKVSFMHINDDFRMIYFGKVYKRHFHLIENNKSICINDLETPVLNISHSKMLNENWILGLTKSFLDFPVQFGDLTLNADISNKILKQVKFYRNLDLQGMEIDEDNLAWWADVSIDKLNVSNTEVKEIRISDNWENLHTLIANNLPLKFCSFLNKLQNLKELDLSGADVQKIIDFKSVIQLPDGISADFSMCNMTNDYLPVFISNTNFKNLYMDCNKISKPDFIYTTNFEHLNISNNPLKELDDNMLKKNVVCNFYFEDEEIENFLCGESRFLTYDEAVKIKEIDISKMNVCNLSGLSSLPNLELITINTFQSLMIDDNFKHSQLQCVKVNTYKLNHLVYLLSIYNDTGVKSPTTEP